MNDEQRQEDERIAAAAREAYNAPPATPRDDMWSAIEARLEEGAPAPDRIGGVDRARVLGRLSWWMGVAAALMIGLGLGRLSLGTGEGEPRVASQQADSEVTGPTTTETPLAGVPEARDVPEAVPPAGEVDRPSGDTSSEPPREAPPGTRDLDPNPNPTSYATATRAHLSRSESFLAGVHVDLSAGSADAEFEGWARSLLSRTRLLLASPAGRDPETRRLLEDLELMLAQVVMTASTSDPAEVRLLGEGLEDGDLLQRLRTSSL